MASKLPELADRLHGFNRRQPFAPYDIKTADGDTFHVPHPDYAIVSERGGLVEVHENDEHVRILGVRLIVSIEPTRPKKGMPGQGGGKR